jgi:hypothetical protein
MDGPRDTVETKQWDDRELMLRIYYQVVETNGTVRQHDRELYGDDHLGLVGLRQIATENCAYRERMKVGLRIGFVVLGALASLLGTILVLLVQHIL